MAAPGAGRERRRARGDSGGSGRGGGVGGCLSRYVGAADFGSLGWLEAKPVSAGGGGSWGRRVFALLTRVGCFVGDDLRDPLDFHTEMEARMRMNW